MTKKTSGCDANVLQATELRRRSACLVAQSRERMTTGCFVVDHMFPQRYALKTPLEEPQRQDVLVSARVVEHMPLHQQATCFRLGGESDTSGFLEDITQARRNSSKLYFRLEGLEV